MIKAINEKQIQLMGLSTDIKPTIWPEGSNLPIENGSIFVEMNTGDVYFFSSAINDWIKPNLD